MVMCMAQVLNVPKLSSMRDEIEQYSTVVRSEPPNLACAETDETVLCIKHSFSDTQT